MVTRTVVRGWVDHSEDGLGELPIRDGWSAQVVPQEQRGFDSDLVACVDLFGIDLSKQTFEAGVVCRR